jgi:NAD(P)-dependent dehydrogenase (short-subunit alcohol dehydrogenase family)
MKLKGKVAIVSAVGRGIGKAIALKPAEEGTKVVVNSFREETTRRVVAEITQKGGEAIGVPGDISEVAMVKETVAKAIEIYGKINILINNVGGVKVDETEDMSDPLGAAEALWNGCFNLNMKAPVLMIEAVTPHFKEQKSGKIINMASVVGRPWSALPESVITPPAAYGAMKSALIRYTQYLADVLGPHNINVNAICPGLIYTDAWKAGSEQIVQFHPKYQGQDPREWFLGIFDLKYMDEFPVVTPLRREQTVEDIANTALFLVSEEACNITGQSINVDGGMSKA